MNSGGNGMNSSKDGGNDGSIGGMTRTESQLFRQYIASHTAPREIINAGESPNPLAQKMQGLALAPSGSKNALENIPGFGADSGSTPDAMGKYYIDAATATGGAS